MLYFPNSKIVDSREEPVAPGAVILAEGQALVRLPGATNQGVLPSTGQAGEIFCGFSVAGVSAAPFPEGYANKVETFVVPQSGSVTLALAPVAGQLLAYDVTAGAAVALTGANPATLNGKTLSGLTPGNTVQATYRYALTVTQARVLFGDVQPGGYAGAQVGQIGAAKRGLIYTSEFDSSVNWAAATAVKLAANGQVTDQSGQGVAVQAVVVAIPSQDIPYLGLDFTAL